MDIIDYLASVSLEIVGFVLGWYFRGIFYTHKPQHPSEKEKQ